MPLWPPYDVALLGSELACPLEVCGLPQEYRTGCNSASAATLFDFKVAIGLSRQAGEKS